jgi:TonB family protein
LWLASLCRAIFWFNPFVHWLNRRLAVLAELTSDAAAVQAIGDRSKYLEVLVRIAGGAASPEVLLPMASRLTLSVRMRQLLAPSGLSIVPSARHNAVLAGAVVLLGAVVAGCVAKPIELSGPAAASALQVGQIPTRVGLKDFYPEQLRRRLIQGKVLVRITVDARGRVVDTSILAEKPAGAGLGAAAESLARAYRFNNILHRPVITTLPVNFVLHAPTSGPPPGEPSRR